MQLHGFHCDLFQSLDDRLRAIAGHRGGANLRELVDDAIVDRHDHLHERRLVVTVRLEVERRVSAARNTDD